MVMKSLSKQKTGFIALVITFILMCAFKLWFTVLAVFTFGLIITLIKRKRSFCSGYCPMAAIQDSMYNKQRKHPRQKNKLFGFLQNRWLKAAAALLFWGYISYFLIFHHSSPYVLWQAMLSLMLASTSIALILQAASRKRVWCSTICPYGNFLGFIVKHR